MSFVAESPYDKTSSFFVYFVPISIQEYQHHPMSRLALAGLVNASNLRDCRLTTSDSHSLIECSCRRVFQTLMYSELNDTGVPHEPSGN